MRPVLRGELSPAESTTLSRLQQLEPVTAADLARYEGISAQSMGATLSSLKAQGLIKSDLDVSSLYTNQYNPYAKGGQ